MASPVHADVLARTFQLVGPLGRHVLTLEAATARDIQTFRIRLKFYQRMRAGVAPTRGTAPLSQPLTPPSFATHLSRRLLCRLLCDRWGGVGPASLPYIAPSRAASAASAGVADDMATVSHVALHPPAARRGTAGAKRADAASAHWVRPTALALLPAHVARFRELKVHTRHKDCAVYAVCGRRG
jgi:hypothetical protein